MWIHEQPHPEEHRVAMRLEGWATTTVYPTLRDGPAGLLRMRLGLHQMVVARSSRDSDRQGGRRRLLAAAILAPQVELLLHRPVGEREQHGFGLGLVHDLGPARHHEMVALLPAQRLVADRALALAFDNREHHAVGAAIGRCRESLGQE